MPDPVGKSEVTERQGNPAPGTGDNQGWDAAAGHQWLETSQHRGSVS